MPTASKKAKIVKFGVKKANLATLNEKMLPCSTFSKSLNSRNIQKSVSDILMCMSGSRLKAVFGYAYPVTSSLSRRTSNRQTG